MAVRCNISGREVWFVKGAVETVLPRCSSFFNETVTQLEGTFYYYFLYLFSVFF